jgi:hypothetical protein
LLFSLFAFRCYAHRKYFFSGAILALAFLTRYAQGILLIPLLLAPFILIKFETFDFLKLFKIIGGFSIVAFPLFVLNYCMYGDVFFPLVETRYILQTDAWWAGQSPLYYLQRILFYENCILLFAIPGMYFIFKEKNELKIIVGLILCIYLFFVSTITVKQDRYLIAILPFLYYVASYGIYVLMRAVLRRRSIILSSILMVVLLGVSGRKVAQVLQFKYPQPHRTIFNIFLEKFDVKGTLWITSPLQIVFSDAKAEGLLYKGFSAERLRGFRQDMDKADVVFLDTFDLRRNPKDKECISERKKFIAELKNSFDAVYLQKYGKEEVAIYVKPKFCIKESVSSI